MKRKAAQVLEIALLLVGVAALTVYGLLELDQMRGQADLRAQFENRETSRLPSELPGEAPHVPNRQAPQIRGRRGRPILHLWTRS